MKVFLVIMLAGLMFTSCAEPELTSRTGHSLALHYQKGAKIKPGAIAYIDSIVLIHGANNNEKLLAADTIFLNSTQYNFTNAEGKSELATATNAELLNKINFILKNYQPFSSIYHTSPEMTALKTGILEISRSDSLPITVRFPESYPIEVTVLDSIGEGEE